MRPLLATLAICLLLASCAPSGNDSEERLTYCPQDNMICPDGSIVMRTGNDCEFVCPEAPKDACGYTDFNRQYWHHDLRECQYTKPSCSAGWVVFSDECGCGCQLENA